MGLLVTAEGVQPRDGHLGEVFRFPLLLIATMLTVIMLKIEGWALVIGPPPCPQGELSSLLAERLFMFWHVGGGSSPR